MARVPVNDEILARAHELLALKRPIPGNRYFPDRTKLRQIITGKIKSIDVDWWRGENGVREWQVTAKAERDFKEKLAALKAMSDPARNPNAHERGVAQAAFARLEAAGPPKTPGLRSAPGLEDYDREIAQRLAARRAEMDAAFKAAKARRDAAMRKAATDSVAPTRPTLRAATGKATTDSVAGPARGKATTNSVAGQDWLVRRTAQRTRARAGLKCVQCGKPLNAQRPTARFCSATCRSQAFRGKPRR
jgi:hypothetical protein